MLCNNPDAQWKLNTCGGHQLWERAQTWSAISTDCSTDGAALAGSVTCAHHDIGCCWRSQGTLSEETVEKVVSDPTVLTVLEA